MQQFFSLRRNCPVFFFTPFYSVILGLDSYEFLTSNMDDLKNLTKDIHVEKRI